MTSLKLKLTLAFILTMFVTGSISQAEILPPAGTVSVQTSYIPSDPVFLFQSLQNIPLRFESPEPDVSYTFEWARYNVEENTWSMPLQTQTGSSATLIVNDPGGYRLRIIKGPDDEEMLHCWVFEPQLTDPAIEVVFEDCFSVELSAQVDSVPLIYYHPVTGDPETVNYQSTYQWQATPPLEMNQGARIEVDAPVENTLFEVTITDISGNFISTELNYTALAVRADYTAEVFKEEIDHEVHTGSETVVSEGSAPIEIRFQDESKGNITSWEWRFGRGNISVDRNPFHVFTSIGTDTVNLRVLNQLSGCSHLMEDPLLVTIMESMLEVPNTFTPNGDGINDEFRVVYRSLRHFNMVIYNRWGRRVYQSTNPAEGWDGTVGGGMGAPGVYFYHIEAEGYQSDEKHKRSGPVHLIRGSN